MERRVGRNLQDASHEDALGMAVLAPALVAVRSIGYLASSYGARFFFVTHCGVVGR
jgi:hypothetical protein